MAAINPNTGQPYQMYDGAETDPVDDPIQTNPDLGVGTAGGQGDPATTRSTQPVAQQTTPATTTPAATATNTITPAYLASLFPNGIPQTAVATAGAVPQVIAPSVAGQIQNGAAQVPSVTQATQGQIGAAPLVSAITAAMQPTFAQQDRATQDALADAGIVGGSSQGALSDLAGTQTDQLAAALAPIEQQAQGYTLQAATTDANNQIGVGTTQAQQILAALQQNQELGNQNTEYNASALNSGNEYNITNDLNAAQYDTGTSNTILSQILGDQNQDWLAELGLQGQTAAGAAGATSAAAAPVYTQMSAPNFSGLASAFAKPSSTPAAPAAPSPYSAAGGDY